MLEDEIIPRQGDQAGKLDLQIGPPIAIQIAIDDGAVIRRLGGVELPEDHLGPQAREIARTAPCEGLIARPAGIGVDAGKVDAVLPMGEVEDDVTLPGARKRVQRAIADIARISRRGIPRGKDKVSAPAPPRSRSTPAPPISVS